MLNEYLLYSFIVLTVVNITGISLAVRDRLSNFSILRLCSVFNCYYVIFLSPQTLWGDIGNASRTLKRYHSVWRKFGFTPEFFQIRAGLPIKDRESYPLRPGEQLPHFLNSFLHLMYTQSTYILLYNLNNT